MFSLPPHFQLLFLFTRGGIATPTFTHKPLLSVRRSRRELQDGNNAGERGSCGGLRRRCCGRGAFHQPAHREPQRLFQQYKTFRPIDSPLKKRKSRHELIDPRLLSLKYKFGRRLSQQDDESARTESLGCDGFFINRNNGTDMVSIPEEVDSCENTLSLFGVCIEVDSKNGIESQSMRKMFEARAYGSSSSSNIFSSNVSSSHSTGSKETDSDDESYPGLMLQPNDNDLSMMYEVFVKYDDLMDGQLPSGDVYGSASRIMDEKLYSNGVDDFHILPAGPTSSYGEKKLTIDQEFEQYFSRLML